MHTLDYPPAFALFEKMLSSIAVYIVPLLGDEGDGDGDQRCLQLLPDHDNEPSAACVLFQRSTVIVSDLILWLGAYLACYAMHHGKGGATVAAAAAAKKDDNGVQSTNTSSKRASSIQNQCTVTSFLLIVFNPGLLWLDHIHFQYNGMLLGILLASLGCLMMGNNHCATSTAATTAASGEQLQPASLGVGLFDLYHLLGAALFALLLNLKHLYLPLAPLYFCYLLERYCLTAKSKRFRFDKFVVLAAVTGTTLVLPWLPFVQLDYHNEDDPTRQIVQIVRRLFPFGRGLVHDYWAANVWALYSFAQRVWQLTATTVLRQAANHLSPSWNQVLVTIVGDDPSAMAFLPEPSPTVCAILLFLSIIPGMQVASSRLTNQKLIEAVVYVSFCTFMLAYHVHEKAILTTLIPLTILVEPTHRGGGYHNILFWHLSIWGLLGLFPLLFRPVELTFKIVSYASYLGLVSVLLQTPPKWTREIQYVTFIFVGITIVLLDVVPIQGKWEFLPLMETSVICAFGLLGCWAMSLWLLARDKKPSR